LRREVDSVIKTLSDAVRLLFASALVEVCEAVDENLAQRARKRLAKQQRAQTHSGSRPEAGG